MFNQASPLVFELVKDLRRNMTDAEKHLWNYLKLGVQGLKFRRQRAIGIYIVDFYCHKIRLIIEADGSIHERDEIKAYDEKREADLKNWGYHVIRFTNDEILKGTEMVLAQISAEVDKLNKSSK